MKSSHVSVSLRILNAPLGIKLADLRHFTRSPVKILSKIVSVAAVLGCAVIETASAQSSEEAFYQQWVEYRDEQISVAFDQIPVLVALHAIRQKTGFQFNLPSSADSKLLNLRLDRSPLEPAVYSLLSTIGFRNFALIYDERGRPSRAVVLGGQLEEASPVPANSSQTPDLAAQPLKAEERDNLHKDLERWGELKQEERGRIEDRLKALPDSEEREQLVKEYGRKLLEIKK